MKIASIVGARPEFVQAAMVSRSLRQRHEEILIHTGQHYDDLMSDVFFRELDLPEPDMNLSVGSSAPSAQVSTLICKLAEAFCEIQPDLVVVRGDTNSTIAGALAARQNQFALVHIEAGMRSFDTSMPEETNRIVTDHLSDILFVTDDEPQHNLSREGIVQGVHLVGDVMYDTYLCIANTILPRYISRVSLPAEYDLLTIHRQANTDDARTLERILAGFEDPSVPVLFPMHPRTRQRISEYNITVPKSVLVVPPLSYLDMLVAQRGARTIYTDSGGVQREAYFTGKPCVTLRENTEWKNTIKAGWNQLVGSNTELIKRLRQCPPETPRDHPQLFGYGDASERILAIVESPESQDTVASWAARRKRRV